MPRGHIDGVKSVKQINAGPHGKAKINMAIKKNLTNNVNHNNNTVQTPITNARALRVRQDFISFCQNEQEHW